MEQSLNELMWQAYNLSLDVCYSELTPQRTCFTPRNNLTEEEGNLAFEWADGLIHKHYERVSSGCCSIQAMIDFDVAKFEQRVKDDIKKLEAVLKRVGKPVVLTAEELRRRGYKY